MIEPNHFEASVTAGRAQWICSFKYNEAERKLAIGLFYDPDHQSEATRILEFESVVEVKDRWTDRDDQCIEGILGAHEELSGMNRRYTFVTDQREIEIETTREPRVYDL
ncbi:hypothetical protein ACXR0O_23455 [Verrucomicrobiota bacterium sgz303538]